MGNLPRYEMGAGSPIQNAIKMDSNHYGIPTAQKGGGFFTPEKLTDNTENYEYYEKPNNFLNYLRDMSANAVIQKALGNKRKGQLSKSEEMGFAQMGMQAPQQAPQQGGQEEQIMQMVAQALQQGASPEEVMQKLVQMGIPEEQAMQVVQMVAEQMQGGQEQASQQMSEEMPQEMPMAQMGMGMSGSDFQEFGFDNQNPLNPYYTGMYDPNEAKQANAELMQGLYSSAQDAFSKPIAKAKQTNAEFYQNMQKLQDMIAKAEQPAIARYGGRYQQQGAVKPSFYDEAMEQYKWFTENPDSWAGDPDMTNEDGSLNLCIDCLNVDWNNPDHIQGITRLMEEGLSKGPHMEENHNMYLTKLKEFGLPEPKLPQKKTMKRGGITRFQSKGITKPTATDAAGFEKWYNETLGNLISTKASEDNINAFIKQAKQWAYDAKIDENQLQGTAGGYSRGADYDSGFMAIQKAWEDDMELAQAQNQNTDPTRLKTINDKRDKAIADLDKKYSNITGDYFYSLPGNPPNSPTTPGTTTTNTNTGGYQFNPAMQQLLGAMAAGYTKTPLFGFRTKRNINALFNQTMADMMLKAQGQGQGTASAAGTNVPGVPAVGPNGAANTWFKDNNINRYDIKQGPNRFKMKIRANQPGQGVVQYDANGKLITTPNGGSGDPRSSKNFDPFATGNFDPYARGTKNPYNDTKFTTLTSQFDPRGYQGEGINFLERARNRMATNKLERLGSKLDQSYQKQQYLDDLYDSDASPNAGSLSKREANRMNYKGLFDRARRYDKTAEKFNRLEYKAPEVPEQRYGGAYAMGGQYQQGGTYYLSDEEIQALINAGYELE